MRGLPVRISYKVIPGICLLCKASSERCLDLCESCENDLPWLRPGCIRCALEIQTPGLLCGACLEKPPPWQSCHAAFRYESQISVLHRAFKFHGNLAAAYLLSELLASYLRSAHPPGSLPPESFLTAVPLHWMRHLKRGFNQAETIARQLSRELQAPLRCVLTRNRNTVAQQSLDRAGRQKNLRNAFVANDQLPGANILLVDDVITTGATAASATEALLAAGAARVDLFCLARTSD